ncbi:hypothetical protein MCEMSHM24_00278 [Comamonadaceae bacterium]|jgi:hypothetical protein
MIPVQIVTLRQSKTCRSIRAEFNISVTLSIDSAMTTGQLIFLPS